MWKQGIKKEMWLLLFNSQIIRITNAQHGIWLIGGLVVYERFVLLINVNCKLIGKGFEIAN